MLRTALEFTQDEINAYIKTRDPVNFGNKNLATLSNIVTQDGKFEFNDPNLSDDHKIIISLVNIEESRIAECQNTVVKAADGTVQKVSPAVNLEFFILFAAYSDDYKSSLRNLTYIISFFQNNNVFSSQNYPHLNIHADDNKSWQKVEKIIFDLQKLSFEQLNNMWGTIGAKYMPSLVYKMRLLRFMESEFQSQTPPILEANLL